MAKSAAALRKSLRIFVFVVVDITVVATKGVKAPFCGLPGGGR